MRIGVIPIPICAYPHSFPFQFPSRSAISIPMGFPWDFHWVPIATGNHIPIVIAAANPWSPVLVVVVDDVLAGALYPRRVA